MQVGHFVKFIGCSKDKSIFDGNLEKLKVGEYYKVIQIEGYFSKKIKLKNKNGYFNSRCFKKLSYQEKLINLMKYKSNRIQGKTGFDFYFHESDELQIKKWTNLQSQKICKTIISDLQNTPAVYITDRGICPFCVNFYDKEGCNLCPYKLTHGNCSTDPDSDYMKIIRKLKCYSINYYLDEGIMLKILEGKEIN